MKQISESIDTLRCVTALVQIPSQRRYIWRWLRSRRTDYLLRAKLPWLTFDAIEFLQRELHPEVAIFEYGSGGSTVFLQQFAAFHVAVEHDMQWYARMRACGLLGERVDYRLVLPEPRVDGKLANEADPLDYASGDPRYAGYTFRRYVAQIDEFPDDQFDWIIIDGRARTSCLQHSLSKVRIGGYIVLDNSDREYYTAKLLDSLSDWKRFDFRGIAPSSYAITTTSIFQRSTE